MNTDDARVRPDGWAAIRPMHPFELTDIEGRIPGNLSGLQLCKVPALRCETDARHAGAEGGGLWLAVRYEAGRAHVLCHPLPMGEVRDAAASGPAYWQGLQQPGRNSAGLGVQFHGGKLILIDPQDGMVHQLKPEDLSATERLDCDPRLQGVRWSTHSRVDQVTGELLFLACGRPPEGWHYGVMDRDRRLTTWMPLGLPDLLRPEGLAITAHYALLHGRAPVCDQAVAAAVRPTPGLGPSPPARLGIVPRRGRPEQVRWFEVGPGWIDQVSNAWEADDGQGGLEIVLIGTRRCPPRPVEAGGVLPLAQRPSTHAPSEALFCEWRVSLRTGQTRERILDDTLNQGFPVTNSALQGLRTRYAWQALLARQPTPTGSGRPRALGLLRYDLVREVCTAYHEGPGRCFGEAPFAPADEPLAEDDGYLVGFMADDDRQASFVVVFQARDLGQGPLARIRLPQRLPAGAGASWVSAARLRRGF